MVLGPAFCTALSAAPMLVRPVLAPQFTNTVAAPTVLADSKSSNGTQTLTTSFRRDMKPPLLKAMTKQPPISDSSTARGFSEGGGSLRSRRGMCNPPGISIGRQYFGPWRLDTHGSEHERGCADRRGAKAESEGTRHDVRGPGPRAEVERSVHQTDLCAGDVLARSARRDLQRARHEHRRGRTDVGAADFPGGSAADDRS